VPTPKKWIRELGNERSERPRSDGLLRWRTSGRDNRQ